MNNGVGAAVNKLIEWDRLMSEGRKEMNKLKLIIQKEAEKDFGSSKVKQLKYWGDDNSCAIATIAEKVEMISYSFLEEVIPEKVLKEFLKEEMQYKLTEPFKKILAPLISGNYTEQKISDVIKEMKLELEMENLAKKKLKGKFDKDVEFLQTIGMDLKAAEHWAYFIAEAAAWERIVKLLRISGHQEGTKEFYEAINGLKQAVIVEETLKIGLDYKEDDE